MGEFDRVEAKKLELLLLWGFIDLPCVVYWADQNIELSVDLSAELIELSLAKTISSALSSLRSLSDGKEQLAGFRRALLHISETGFASLEQASEFVDILYSQFQKLPYENIVHGLSGFWNYEDMAREGILSDVDKIIENFRHEMKEIGLVA